MYELVRVSESCYYLDCPAKIGIVRGEEDSVFLIDSGNDKDAGKRVLRILTEQGWKLSAIFNTHSHADHIGGNAFLQAKTGCKIYAPELELDFVRHPLREPMYLYGGNPPKELQTKFLCAKESDAQVLSEEVMPRGLSFFYLPGHSFQMVGFRFEEGVSYMADCLASEETLQKYQVSFLVDVEGYLQTLEDLKGRKGDIYIPAHAPVGEDLSTLAEVNILKVREILSLIRALCEKSLSFEEILQGVFVHYGLKMDISQYALVGSTLRSYITYLLSRGELGQVISENKVLYQAQI